MGICEDQEPFGGFECDRRPYWTAPSGPLAGPPEVIVAVRSSTQTFLRLQASEPVIAVELSLWFPMGNATPCHSYADARDRVQGVGMTASSEAEGWPPSSPAITVPIDSLLPARTPRLAGEDDSHIRMLAETENELPPILVCRRSFRVIDGMHRLRAARLRGAETIKVRFVD